MNELSRRSFIAATAAGLAATPHLFDRSQPGGTAVVPPAPAAGKSAFQPSTLFLTWYRDPTTTMTVQWIGSAGETDNTTIYYRPKTINWSPSMAPVTGVASTVQNNVWLQQPTFTKPYPLSEFTVFRSELFGLIPGMDYDFRIGTQSPVYRFRTMPSKATNALQFISGGDCGVNNHTVANNIQAARQDPMFAIVGGDLGYDNGKSVDTSINFIKNYSKHMIGRNGRLIPLIACLGNHEVDGGYGTSRVKAPFFYALFDGLYPDTGYSTLDFGDYLSIVLLDTGHTSKIDGDQTHWLEKTLKARQDHPHVMVVNHVPAYPSARGMEGTAKNPGTGEPNRKHWVPLFEKYRVPIILEHHDHTFKRTRPMLDGLMDDDGVVYLGDGSWGQIRPPQPAEKLRHLALYSQEYHLTMHRIQGEDRYHLALDENGRVMDICHTGQRPDGLVPAS